MNHPKILLIAGGGTIGTYVALELLKLGYEVDVVALEALISDCPNLHYLQANVDDAFLEKHLAENKYDAIIDFLHYPDPVKYHTRSDLLLGSTKHLIFLSSYRVYADCEHPIRETSPQLLDVCPDDTFLMKYDNYGISKSFEERILQQSGNRNWTIVRPLISFSHLRFDLITQGANTLLVRPAQGKPILLPRDATDLTAGLTWAGNTGKMIARLVLNQMAYGEAYTLGTGEMRTWREVAEYYTKLNGAQFIWVDTQTYLAYATQGQVWNQITLHYDRLYDRAVDNSKILNATHLTAADFTSIEEALVYELRNALNNPDSRLEQTLHSEAAMEINSKMDAYLNRQ